MKNEKDLVIILGSSSFPYEISAANVKNELTARSLIRAGYDVFILSKISTVMNNKSSNINYLKEGQKNGINYRFVGGEVFKPKNFIVRQKSLLRGLRNEYKFYKKNKHRKITILLSITWFHLIIYYYIISKILKLQIVMSIMEWHVVQEDRSGLQKVNDYLFDNWAPKLFKKAIPISNYIDDKLKERNTKLKTYILPVLTDIDEFKNVNVKISDKYFLYCGHAGYIDVIYFVINSFKRFHDKNENIKMHLVINGSKTQLEKLSTYIDLKGLTNYIRILTKIPYRDLIIQYKNTLALLIPLRETEQDRARFPQKIAEYVSTCRPIITNEWGEVKFYFKNRVNAYICNRCDEIEFCETMMEIVNDPNKSDEIGKNAFLFAEEYFNYSNHSEQLKSFING